MMMIMMMRSESEKRERERENILVRPLTGPTVHRMQCTSPNPGFGARETHISLTQVHVSVKRRMGRTPARGEERRVSRIATYLPYICTCTFREGKQYIEVPKVR